MRRSSILLGLALLIIATAVVFFRLMPAGAELLWQISDGGTWLLPLVIVSALLDSINPCAFSILLLTLAVLLSLGAGGVRIKRLGWLYVFGLFLSYLLIGLGLLQALHLFNTPHFMAKVGAVLLIFWGIWNAINEIFPSFPIKPRIPTAVHHRLASLIGKAAPGAVLLLGALVGLCEFPCTGGPYLMVLGFLHDRATYLIGVQYLLLYNAIFILPLIVVLLLATKQGMVERFRSWQQNSRRSLRVLISVLMIGLGFLAFFL